MREVKDGRMILLPCGQCIGCRTQKRQEWAARIMCEAQLHLVSAFVTLTYAPEHLPPDGSLNYEHFQLFMRRLRKAYGKVRFFMCGEYGEELRRPHYHAILFGWWPADARRLQPDGGDYESARLTQLWGLGHTHLGQVTAASAEYVAGYTVKKINGALAADHYTVCDAYGELHELVPEFGRMSLKPGIGADWLKRYWPEVVAHDGIHLNERRVAVPRYFNKLLKSEIAPDRMEAVETNRIRKAAKYAGENTRERRAVREECAQARQSLKRRKLEAL